ncbi:unnamed protein product [Leptidea sinapis]|uniref:K Homology domain-containing protein n=1 Tax=Leptidea sinapis TaxID=189913 RepID=A0A5E4QR79_9NEOP|nr:unnamed protein product [Leptidea sinapis]
MDDTMSTLTKMTRTVKKLEVPRPLKSTTSSALNRNSVLDVKINSVDDLIVLTEAVAYQMMQGNFDRVLQSNVSTMYSNLKLYGAQLESLYKDFLDRYFVVFRNGSQDERLDKKTRLHLLELIELRAKQWQGSDYMSQYYRHRGTHAEPLLVPTMEGAGSGGSVSPTLAAPAEPQTLLGPGEVIKPSGKFPKPTKIPGKNYSKDEVVIRNADSGKVMGIKGRRVHMIEELSDTIISFQRVSPGAKEPPPWTPMALMRLLGLERNHHTTMREPYFIVSPLTTPRWESTSILLCLVNIPLRSLAIIWILLRRQN